jgi:hypothetical protein
MSGLILDAPQIHGLIRRLSPKHILRKSPQSYADDFVKAALEAYDPDTLQKTLLHKFHIPDESNYSDEVYYQSASELSVSYYLKQKEKNWLVTNFELEKRLNFNPNDNPPNLKGVDNFFHGGPTKVSVEVKCPQEDKQAPFPGTITLKSAGRLPDPKLIDRMRDELESRSTGASGSKFAKGKNPDLRIKDCLESANEKFNSKCGVDDLNVLFLSCGRYDKMNEWYNCLCGPQGLFTGHSFAPEARCPKVDVVIISNLRYRHEYARAYPAWTLDDVLLLPVVNSHRRSNWTTEAIEEGLGVFNHYLKGFASFEPSGLVWNEHSETQVNIQRALKVNYFVMEYLKPGEFARFLPNYRPGKGI